MSRYGLIGNIDDTLLEIGNTIDDVINFITNAQEAGLRSEANEYLEEALSLLKDLI